MRGTVLFNMAAGAVERLRLALLRKLFDGDDDDFDPKIDFEQQLLAEEKKMFPIDFEQQLLAEEEQLFREVWEVDRFVAEANSIGTFDDLICDIDVFEAKSRGDLPPAKRGRNDVPPSSTSREADVRLLDSVREAKIRLEAVLGALTALDAVENLKPPFDDVFQKGKRRPKGLGLGGDRKKAWEFIDSWDESLFKLQMRIPKDVVI